MPQCSDDAISQLHSLALSSFIVPQCSDDAISQLHLLALSTFPFCSALKLIQSVEPYVTLASGLLLKHNYL